jgi:hypothetical protein
MILDLNFVSIFFSPVKENGPGRQFRKKKRRRLPKERYKVFTEFKCFRPAVVLIYLTWNLNL